MRGQGAIAPCRTHAPAELSWRTRDSGQKEGERAGETWRGGLASRHVGLGSGQGWDVVCTPHPSLPWGKAVNITYPGDAPQCTKPPLN